MSIIDPPAAGSGAAHEPLAASGSTALPQTNNPPQATSAEPHFGSGGRTTKAQKLELTWIGKDTRPRLEPRVLVEDVEKSYHASTRKPGDIFDNKLIFGDNLLALKALEAEYSGKVKCIFIDPPYNTGSAFTHYDDGVEHSLWLSLMRDRLELLRKLLSEDGSLWVTLDDNEAHYFKVLCDEVFGRANFVANCVWQKKFSPQNDAKWISGSHDHLLCYAMDKMRWRPNALPRSYGMDNRYKNPDNDCKGVWTATDLTRAEHRDRDYWGLTTPSGKIVFPAKGRSWSRPKENIEKLMQEGRLWFGPRGANLPRLKKYLSEMDDGLTPQTIWFHNEVGNNQEAKKEVLSLGVETVFDTPKPERLIHRVLHLATNPGDLVLDSFAGSGTTGAVAHKMGRRWIMVELGEHCHTHIIPRLQRVIDGKDPGGITEATGWKGGGGFRYYKLAPSLLKRDKWGQWVVNSSYNPELLAEALCKMEGYQYAPSTSTFWQQGKSSETDYLYVTTATLSEGQLRELSQDVGPERSLLICCGAWIGNPKEFQNLTLRKIPQSVLARYEFDRDDYSLSVNQLPVVEPEPTTHTLLDARPAASKARNKGKTTQTLNLFGDQEI